MRQQHVTLCSMVIFLAGAITLFVLSIINNISSSGIHTFVSVKKNYLYLLQCESCLSDYHLAKENLGDGTTHDVLVLSYRSRCTKNHPKHIKYIRPSNRTTWTSGRNYLYRYIRYRTEYLYYIFMDQDIQLVRNPYIAKYNKTFDQEGEDAIQSSGNYWRKFEAFLDSYRPAIGVVERKEDIELILKGMTHRHQISPYVSGFLFDAMFNAFHADVIHDLLPYNETFEKETWDASQQILHCKMFFKYHAQMIIYLPILGVNDGHSEYPKQLVPPRKYCQHELNFAPSFMEKSQLTIEMLGKDHVTHVPYYKYVAPKNTQFRKYSIFGEHFESEHYFMYR